MSEDEDIMDVSDSYEDAPSAKKNGRTSLLDSGEDFELLNDEDIDDAPPPLEDAGGGKGKSTDEIEKKNADPDPPVPVDEWLDVLGMWEKHRGILSGCGRTDSIFKIILLLEK